MGMALKMAPILTVLLSLCATIVVEAGQGGPTAAPTYKPGKWEQCIGPEIAKCMSCVFQDIGTGLDAVIDACVGNEGGTVTDVLKATGKAITCGMTCAKAST